MSTVEDLFQEHVERLQGGEPLEACSAGLPDQEAELLALVAGLQALDYPQPEEAAVAAQRAEVLRLARAARDARPVSSGRPRWPTRLALPRWFAPVAALSRALALLLVCVLLAVAGVGPVRPRSRDAETPPAIAAAPATAEVRVSQTPTPGVRATATASRMPTRELAPTFTAEPAPQQVARAAPLEAPDAKSAVLRGVRGLAQVDGADGAWTVVPAEGRIVRAGDRVRTGALSSATLAFYDGSVAHLGPNSELSVDELDARRSGGPRVVVLTQSSGESEHDVVPSSGEGARYRVHTPSGTGGARGTRFQVRIASALLAYFSVDEGSIWVSHMGGTVVVAAGQVTVVRADVAPSAPFFRVTGEGEVQEIGATWKIAGQVFETHEATVVVGNPQVGDWVHVEGRLLSDGTRVADAIVLLRRSPVNRFTVQGRVDAIGEAEWTVAGRAIAVGEGTDVEEGIEEGDQVRVEGVILEDGTLLAERIALVEEEAPGLPFHFTGVIQEIGEIDTEVWTISGVSITVDDDTALDEGLIVGDLVEVEGWILAGSTWLARSIVRLEEEEHTFEFTGSVWSIDPWVVSGVDFETDDWTETEPGIEVGNTVRVAGRILEDGTWMATEIELLDPDEFVYIEFVGRVEKIDPWVVSDVPLTVDDDTEIVGDIQVDDWVRVRARVLPDGAWLAVEIELVDITQRGGCMWFSSVVARVGSDLIVLNSGATIPLDSSISIEGEIKVNSVILILICVDEDGTLTVLRIVVIYQFDTPVVAPPAVAPSRPEESYVTICHKPGTPAEQTKVIPTSALEGHLGHGDVLDPCEGDGEDHKDKDH